MARQTTIHLPIGYQLELTADGNTYGAVYYIGAPGADVSGTTVIPASSSAIIGPFNELREYRIVSTSGEIQYTTALSGTFTKYDETYHSENYVLVDNLDDLPAAVDGVITLADDTAYRFTTSLDLSGARFVGGNNTAILGTSSETSVLTSTGLQAGVAFFTTTGTTPIQNISFVDIDTCFSIDGQDSAAMDWNAFNIINCPNIGTISNVTNWILTNSAFVNSSNLEFDGTLQTAGVSGCLFTGDGTAADMIKIASTAEITRRFRIIYSAVVVPTNNTGINVDAGATIHIESYILDSLNFSGAGTYVAGTTNTDNKSKFVECNGITNTANLSSYSMTNNATATAIASSSTPVKVAGTTTQGNVTQRFTHTNNRLTFNGAITRDFVVTAVATLDSGNNNEIGLYIAKNGTEVGDSEMYTTTNSSGRSESVAIQAIIELSTDDYIEIFVENNTLANDVTVSYLNVIARALN